MPVRLAPDLETLAQADSLLFVPDSSIRQINLRLFPDSRAGFVLRQEGFSDSYSWLNHTPGAKWAQRAHNAAVKEPKYVGVALALFAKGMTTQFGRP
jgi:hypothetical protein